MLEESPTVLRTKLVWVLVFNVFNYRNILFCKIIKSG